MVMEISKILIIKHKSVIGLVNILLLIKKGEF